MNNAELDGVPLSDFEISLVRIERARVKFIEEKNAKQDICDHNFSRYLGHGHNDESYECIHCEKVKYE